MSAWTVVPCLLALREEFNRVSPNRDRGADGTIGDTAHTSSSDHTPDEDSAVLRDHDADGKNEVHALDIDSSGPWPEPGWFNRTILALVAREKAEYESKDVFGRLQYVIWNGRIASRSVGWAWHTYTGSDKHTNHAHFSARYLTSTEADTRPWGVIEEDDVTPEDRTKIAQETAELLQPGLTQLLTAVRQDANGSLQRDTADAARDAQVAATLAGMQTALSALASASGSLSPEQVAALTEQVRGAARAAGAEAVSAVAEQIKSLREHLGDDDAKS